MNKLTYMLACAAMAGLCACSSPSWRVSGNVANAPEGTKLAVEGFNGALWFPIDSIEVGPNGDFEYVSAEAAPYPNIYRLGLNGRSIYFPIDSVDIVTVTADAESFDNGYVLDGTPLAEDVLKVDRLIAASVAQNGTEGALADSLLKAELNTLALADEEGLVGYYIINKAIGNRPLYDPANRKDLAMVGAIANRYNMLYPNDPRTKALATRFLQGRRDAGIGGGFNTEIEATVLSLFDIELFDQNGQKQSLAQVAGQGHVTLLSFTSYDVEASLPYNVELNRLYQQFRPNNLQIYQVAFDPDEVEWMQSARNLPWIAVRNNPADGDALLRKYNVGAIPLTFVIDKNGDLVERIVDPTELERAIKRHL